jgi:hypothetical protein
MVNTELGEESVVSTDVGKSMVSMAVATCTEVEACMEVRACTEVGLGESVDMEFIG